ncbi:hypothetical protein QOZ80_7BG0600560 [Eleusine coracana subsp. coracana]|nr:hypothetical protein QOZ80_7BG0600560 [Eleusine coracana subsp. coracana]
MEALSLIDVSGEDDLFLGLASPPALPQPPDRDPPRAGFCVSAAEAAADSGPTGDSPVAAGRAAHVNGGTEDETAPERAESPKQRKAKTGVNLRKSLAWDSAFFTSEGVLDTEELAIVNSTFRKTQGSRLPGITEESRRSGESTTSTLESESWVMESIETELFDNVRASIQRSLGKPNKVTTKPPADSKPSRATANAPRVAARKRSDQMPQMKIRAPVSTSQGVGGKQRPQVTSKEPTAARVILAQDGEAKPSSRPPRALPRVATMRSSTNTSIASGISDKRSSTGGVGNRHAVGKSTNTSAGVRPGGMKSSSVAKTGDLTTIKTKPDTKNISATISSTKRTAQRIPIRPPTKYDCSKTKPARSSGNIPARVHSARASPNISPNSSIDSMSSVISGASTASTVGKMSHTSEVFSSLSPSLRKSNDHPLTTKLRPPIVTEGQSSATRSSGDSLIATSDTTDKGKGSKPLGLRRPKPKIGFFDSEKSTDQVHSKKVQGLLPITPKSKLSSTQMTNTAAASFGQQEPKSTAPPEESGAFKSRVVKALSDEVAQMDAVPFNVVEPEACTQTGPVVPQPETEKSIVQTVGAQVQRQLMEIKCPLPVTPNSQQSSAQTMILASSSNSKTESKSTAVSLDKMIVLTSEAVPFEVAQTEVVQMETFASTTEVVKVAEHEACSHKTGPKPFNVAQTEVAQMETFASTTEVVKVAEHEACSHETGPKPFKVAQTKVAQMETFPSTTEVVKVVEHEGCSHETGPVVDEQESGKSIDQNIGPQVQGQPVKTQLSIPGAPNSPLYSTNPAACTLDQQVLRSTEAPHEESNALKSKTEKVVTLKVAKAGEPFEMADLNVVKMEVVKVEAFMHQTSPLVTTAEASKENIPALHQNVQANDDANSFSVEQLIQKLSSVSLGSAPDMTS